MENSVQMATLEPAEAELVRQKAIQLKVVQVQEVDGRIVLICNTNPTELL